MRFITEFENDGTKYDDAITDHRKEWRQNELGKLIADTFGWTERGVTSLRPGDSIKERFSLEIEAFPMDKWVEFKRNVIMIGSSDSLQILDMIMELESFGKPSGDAITNQQLNK